MSSSTSASASGLSRQGDLKLTSIILLQQTRVEAVKIMPRKI